MLTNVLYGSTARTRRIRVRHASRVLAFHPVPEPQEAVFERLRVVETQVHEVVRGRDVRTVHQHGDIRPPTAAVGRASNTLCFFPDASSMVYFSS